MLENNIEFRTEGNEQNGMDNFKHTIDKTQGNETLV